MYEQTVSILCIFAVYPKTQDGNQKWWENKFWQKVVYDSVYILGAKKFIEIALAHTVSKLNALNFTPKFKMASKSGRKAIF